MKAIKLFFALSLMGLFVTLLVIGCEGSASFGNTPTDISTAKTTNPSVEYTLVNVLFKEEMSGKEVNPLIGELALRYSVTPQFLTDAKKVRGFTGLLPSAAVGQLAGDSHVLSVKESETEPMPDRRCDPGCHWSHRCGCLCPGSICWF